MKLKWIDDSTLLGVSDLAHSGILWVIFSFGWVLCNVTILLVVGLKLHGRMLLVC